MKIDYDGDFRVRWSKRREIAVSAIATAAAGECLETELERLKAESGYERLSDRDRANFRRFCSDVRTVWSRWNELGAAERQSFMNHQLVYSTLANEIRERFA